MPASDHKVGSPIKVWQNLVDKIVGQGLFVRQKWDEVGEIVRQKHDDLCDFIDADIATKTEMQSVTLGQIPDGTISRLKLETSLQYGFNPVGTVISLATSNVPSGYLECNGALVSRTTYANLFNVIGTTFGAGDGSTTFALPDLRGEFIRGWDHGRGVDSGRSIGSQQSATSVVQGSYSMLSRINDAENIGTNQSSLTGSSEVGTGTKYAVRPRNVALMYCIKY